MQMYLNMVFLETIILLCLQLQESSDIFVFAVITVKAFWQTPYPYT